MTDKERFEYLLETLIKRLVKDGKITYDEASGKYKLRTNINAIIKHYDCKDILKLCVSKEELRYCIVNNDSPFNHYCPICHKQVMFNGYGYNKTCRNKECLCQILLNNDALKDKRHIVINEYLNGDKEFNSIQIGFIEKYGVWMNSQLKGWKESINNTWKTKTDEELDVRRQKTIHTCRERYGCDFSQQNEAVKDKQRHTWAAKTDEELQHKNDARRQTTLERYGVDHIMKSQEVLNSVKERHYKEYGYYHWIQAKINHKDVYLDDSKFAAYVKAQYNINNDRIKKTDLDKHFNVNCTTRLKELHLLKYVRMHESKLENMFKELFGANNIKYEWRNRSIIDGPHGKSHCYELDFYLPEYNIGIEINDIATHNAISLEGSYYGSKYHVYKTNNCKVKGIRLIHIWEWEAYNDFDKISRWLLNELNDNKQKIFARKCDIRLVSKEDEKQFLNTYHLQGYSKSDICLGLYYNNELIEVMSFSKPRFSKRYEYELLRLCAKYNVSVIGGTNKLFKRFIKEYSPSSVISYCDYSKFSGGTYEKMGMAFDKLTKPMIIYCNYDMKTINESILNKYGVDNLLRTSYGKGADNKEAIMNEGYLPVPNCGNLIYEYKNNI